MARKQPKPLPKKNHKGGKKTRKQIDLNNQILKQFK